MKHTFKNNKIDFHLLWDEKYNNGTYDLEWLVADCRVKTMLLGQTCRGRSIPNLCLSLGNCVNEYQQNIVI